MFLVIVSVLLLSLVRDTRGFDYSDALERSLVFYEGQRSGMIPHDQRMYWRGNSALTDGNVSNVSYLQHHLVDEFILSWLHNLGSVVVT